MVGSLSSLGVWCVRVCAVSQPLHKTYVCLPVLSASTQDTSAEVAPSTSATDIEGLNLEDILKEKKFSYKARLFVANVAGIDLATFKGLFSAYGEIRDVHLNKEKGFGFLKLVSCKLQFRHIYEATKCNLHKGMIGFRQFDYVLATIGFNILELAPMLMECVGCCIYGHY